ncbi:MAG: hypothetical protein JXJ04_26170 [Spirochaetales bacterium]|nr:hypothetical protein [Spirochaetales bacterium]
MVRIHFVYAITMVPDTLEPGQYGISFVKKAGSMVHRTTAVSIMVVHVYLYFLDEKALPFTC